MSKANRTQPLTKQWLCDLLGTNGGFVTVREPSYLNDACFFLAAGDGHASISCQENSRHAGMIWMGHIKTIGQFIDLFELLTGQSFAKYISREKARLKRRTLPT